jgi:hypothetical protein
MGPTFVSPLRFTHLKRRKQKLTLHDIRKHLYHVEQDGKTDPTPKPNAMNNTGNPQAFLIFYYLCWLIPQNWQRTELRFISIINDVHATVNRGLSDTWHVTPATSFYITSLYHATTSLQRGLSRPRCHTVAPVYGITTIFNNSVH